MGENMNHRKKVWIISLIILILLVIILFFINFKNSNQPLEPETDIKQPNIENKSYLNTITGKELDEDIKETIIEYMDTYYTAMKHLEEKDMTYLFDDESGEQALINQTALSLLIQARKMKQTDLTLSDVKYDLDIQTIDISQDNIKIVLRESSYLHFNFMKDIESKIYDIENTFVLRKIDNKYKISQYSKTQDFFVMITDKYTKSGKEKLDKIKNDYLTLIKQNIEKDKKDYIEFLNGIGINKKVCSHAYNREQALEYAKTWVNKRNPEWSTFDANCQNYVSQVLYSGGIPMDYKGNAVSHLQWKFYNPSYNEREIASGYIYTWTYVPYFYTYAKNNTGLGLCADVDVNIYYAEVGDIIHVGTTLKDTGPSKHAVVAIGPYKKDNKVLDILVNSNTVDLENFPLSAYVYPYVSLIKIYGYND